MSEEENKEVPEVKTSVKVDPKKERMWAMICHLSAFVNLIVWIPAANILGPLIIWAWKRTEIPLLDAHAKEAMNFQISLLIYMATASLLCFIFIGFLLLPVISIGGVILVIIAAIKANNGEEYRYPFTLRFIK